MAFSEVRRYRNTILRFCKAYDTITPMRPTLACLSIVFCLLLAQPAAAKSFSDVPEDHTAYNAIEALKQAGIIQGYADGTFKPEKLVNRAEAVKIILGPLLPEEELKKATETVYTDVPQDAWFMPYVEWARQGFKIIDGPPKATEFHGGRTVILVEFLKMSQGAYALKPLEKNTEVKLALSSDVTNPDEWYYPYMRMGLYMGMLNIDEGGKLHPAKQLTRADTALLMYKLLAYKQAASAQALLDQSTGNMNLAIDTLENGVIGEAAHASVRALLTTRGAMGISQEVLVKSLGEIGKALRSLVRGYQAGEQQNFAEALRLADEVNAYTAAAVEQHTDMEGLAERLDELAEKIRSSAKEMSGG